MVIESNVIFAMGDGKENAIHVKQNEIIEFYTRDCFDNQITSEDYVLDELNWSHINPATGPVYVEGAKAGDVLKVEILDIVVDDEGTMSCLPGSGVLGKDITKRQVKKIPVKEGYCMFNTFKLPVNPMIGVIGVAPEGDSVGCGTPGNHGGNMDNNKIVKGSTLYLPIFHDGAYFACGDVHACMGDGEIMVTGVEIAAKVTVRLNVIKGISIDNPRLEDDKYIYTIASDEDMEKAVYNATKAMNCVLQKHLDYDLNEAGMLLSACGNLQICQVVDPKRTVRMAVSKEICNKVL